MLFSLSRSMPIWNMYNFQEGYAISMELLNYFHDYMMTLLLLVFSFVTYLFVYVSFSPFTDTYTMDSHELETVWTILPMVILLFMAFPSLLILYLMEEISNPSISVKVVGHQWYWEYQYFNSWFNHSFDSYMVTESDSYVVYHNLDVDNRLILPTNSSILFLVTSADVLHSWAVPSLGLKVDSVPGRLNYLSTFVPSSGVYYGQCSEICGSNHSFMPIVLELLPMESFLSYMSNLL